MPKNRNKYRNKEEKQIKDGKNKKQTMKENKKDSKKYAGSLFRY